MSGALPIIALFLSFLLVRLILLFSINRISASSGALLNKILLDKFLQIPLTEATSIQRSTVLAYFQYITTYISCIVKPLFTIFTNAISIVFISLGMFYISFASTTIILAGISFLYLFNTKTLSPVFKQISSTINHWSPISISIVNSIVDSAEEIRIYKWERSLSRYFYQSEKKLKYSMSSRIIYSNLPKLVIEVVALFLVAMIIGPGFSWSGSVDIAIVGSIFLAFQRLISPVQQLFASYSTISTYSHVLDALDTFLGVNTSFNPLSHSSSEKACSNAIS